MNEILLTDEELSFLEDVLRPMLTAYEEESKDFEDEEYYASREMNFTNDILKKITNQLNQNKDE